MLILDGGEVASEGGEPGLTLLQFVLILLVCVIESIVVNHALLELLLHGVDQSPGLPELGGGRLDLQASCS